MITYWGKLSRAELQLIGNVMRVPVDIQKIAILSRIRGSTNNVNH